jgi:hypothetical protein
MTERIIRIRMSVKVSDNAPSNEESLKEMKPAIERAVASAIPADFAVNTVKVTRINFAKPQGEGNGESDSE